MAKPKPTPWDLTVRFEVPSDDIDAWPDPEHATVIIEPPIDAFASTMAETVAAFQWCAGVLARIACSLTPDLMEMRRGHGGCRRSLEVGDFGCGTRLEEWHPDEVTAPILTINLRTDNTELEEEWLPRIQQKLEAVLAADQWQPAPEQEAEWAAG